MKQISLGHAKVLKGIKDRERQVSLRKQVVNALVIKECMLGDQVSKSETKLRLAT